MVGFIRFIFVTMWLKFWLNEYCYFRVTFSNKLLSFFSAPTCCSCSTFWHMIGFIFEPILMLTRFILYTLYSHQSRGIISENWFTSCYNVLKIQSCVKGHALKHGLAPLAILKKMWGKFVFWQKNYDGIKNWIMQE